MKFFIEVPPLTGMTDVMDVQAIGRELGDGIYVVEAETQDEAPQKLLDLLSMRVDIAKVRPATEDEADEFAKKQCESYLLHEDAVRILDKFRKGHGNEQPS